MALLRRSLVTLRPLALLLPSVVPRGCDNDRRIAPGAAHGGPPWVVGAALAFAAGFMAYSDGMALR